MLCGPGLGQMPPCNIALRRTESLRQGAIDRVVRYPEIEGDRVRELDGKFCACADRSGLSTFSSEN